MAPRAADLCRRPGLAAATSAAGGGIAEIHSKGVQVGRGATGGCHLNRDFAEASPCGPRRS